MIYAKCTANMSQARTTKKLERRAKFKWREKGSTLYLGNVCTRNDIKFNFRTRWLKTGFDWNSYNGINWEIATSETSFTWYIFAHKRATLRRFPQNIRAIMAKIKLPKKPHGMVIFWIQLRTYPDLSSQADPAKENWTWSYPYFN